MANELHREKARGPSGNAAFVKAGREWLRRRGGSAESRQALLELTARQFLTAPLRPADASAPTRCAKRVRAELGGPTGLFDDFTFDHDEAGTNNGAVTPAVLGDLYEATLPDRRRSGVYYTPGPVVLSICAEAMVASLSTESDRPSKSIRPPRILDPACGCGAFLVGMHLLMEALNRELGDRKPGPPIPVKFVGIDLDAEALNIARCRLTIRKELAARQGWPKLVDEELIVGDSLELEHSEPFDIVIGNPPYGTKAPRTVRNRFFPAEEGSQARDMYGLFIARALELLRPGGSLGFVVSDTFRTIRQHRPLRKRLLEQTTIRSVIDQPRGLFDAAVNTCVLMLVNSPPPDDHEMVSSIPDNRGWHRVGKPYAPDFYRHRKPQPSGHTNRGARYRQALPLTYDSCPIFTCSAEIFRRFTDSGLQRLGEAARIVQGLATGDNAYFLRRIEGARGQYRVVDDARILAPEEIAGLSAEEKINGVDPTQHGGRSFVPYDKGGQNHTRLGLLANYYRPSEYYIDWSHEAVARLRSRRSRRQNGRIASRFQNADCYFVPGITWSDVGYYSPTFRLSGPAVFDVKGSRIIPHELERLYLLGLLCSSPVRFFLKAIANHTVSTQVEDIRRIPLPRCSQSVANDVRRMVDGIVRQQQAAPEIPHDYRAEQEEIDRIFFGLYGLTKREQNEIRRWHHNRYPGLENKTARQLKNRR